MRRYLLLFGFLAPIFAMSQSYYMFVGTYTGKGSKGIYVYKFDPAVGKATLVSSTDSASNPSYLAVSPNGENLYAVNETGGKTPGAVSAYKFNRQTGKLTYLNQQVTGGDHPCYVSITHDNKLVAVANYSGGSLAAYQLNSDGSLKPFTQHIQHSGNSVNAKRQDKPHVHSAVFSPDEQYLFTPDLGMDRIMVYEVNKSNEQPLSPANPAYTAVKGGNGPRHFTFHPNGKFAYLMQEMSGTVGAYSYSNGKLTLLQDVAAHPEGFSGTIGSADIHVSPDGKFLYASNRGDENNIAIFEIDDKSGKLSHKGYQSTKGKTPRNFMIDPTGNYLLVANQDSDNIVIFKRDKSTGLLEDTGNEIKVSMPVCIKMSK